LVRLGNFGTVLLVVGRFGEVVPVYQRALVQWFDDL
jgi:hypothetical protein